MIQTGWDDDASLPTAGSMSIGKSLSLSGIQPSGTSVLLTLHVRLEELSGFAHSASKVADDLKGILASPISTNSRMCTQLF